MLKLCCWPLAPKSKSTGHTWCWISLKVTERLGWNEWTHRNMEQWNFKKFNLMSTIKYWALWMMNNCIIISFHWPTHWLGEVLMHDETSSRSKPCCLQGHHAEIDRDRTQLSLSWWNSFNPSSSLSLGWWEQELETHCAVKDTSQTGCPTPLSPPHSIYPQLDAWPQASLKKHCEPAQLFANAQVELTHPNQQLLSKNDNFSPLLKEGSQVNCHCEMCCSYA